MGEPIWILGIVAFLKGLARLYDLIIYIPWMVIDNPRWKRKQSAKIKARPVSEQPNAPYRTVDCFHELTVSMYHECVTLDDLFIRAVRLFGPLDCLGTREFLAEEDEKQSNGKVFKKLILGEYHWETFDEVSHRISNLGSGLRALGQKPRSNICIFADTRAEWMITAQACFRYNFTLVTLYATLGEDAVVHGINEADVTHIVTTGDLLPKFKNILNRMPQVTHLVYMEEQGKLAQLDGFPSNITVHSMKQVEDIGSRPEHIGTAVSKPTREDLAVIMYTSGSTGLPKGVMISHGNLMAGMSGQVERVVELSPSDTYIGYLPLAHVLELSAEIGSISSGVKIGYSSPNTLADTSSKIKKGTPGDATVLKPTLIAAVPIIMDRLYKGVWEKVNGGGPLVRALFKFFYDYKLRKINRGYDCPFLNRSIFAATSKLLGGRVRMMLSGGAPLSSDTQKFMNICFCCPIGQGYGLTETCGAATVQHVWDLSTGRVGAPLQCNEIMLRDWVEGGYTSKDTPNPRGEVLIGGGNVTMGYYKNPEKTKEDFITINGQRWFCSGDIGQFEPDGCLKIIDRKKDLVKLQGGEYVSLSKVETVLNLCPMIDNVCVYADPMKMFTIGLVVPNQKAVGIFAKSLGLDTEDLDAICKNEAVEKEVLKSLSEFAKKGKLERFEVPAKITLVTDIWSPDTGLVTDAFKLKRRNIEKQYQDDITRMYA